jgi:hypothetical protein
MRKETMRFALLVWLSLAGVVLSLGCPTQLQMVGSLERTAPDS